MTSMRIGARKRHEIQQINATAGLRMAALLPESAEGPPDAEPSVYETPVADPPPTVGAPTVGAPTATGPPGGPSPGAATPGDAGPDGAAPEHATTERAGPRWTGHALALDRRAALGLLVLLLLTVGYGVQHFWLARPQPVEVPAVAVASVPSGGPGPGPDLPSDGGTGAAAIGDVSGTASSTVVVVDVGGRVHTPGVHILPSGSRVADALRVAGGPLPGTDTRNLNLARVLTDGEQILVGEPGPQPPAGAGPGPPLLTGPSRQPVSLNHATLEQLDTLPGVGPTLAQRIIAFRASHGGAFRSLDQLRQVSGIGDRTYAELRPLLTL
ncbi:ComEA family DNA-binding protein [Kitasatospora sp. NPDC093806]|uniref:ComEA family DNA-binding protein n=1 Tax=Kitasatospora sp. NPDC093806 TaxID=3155075 RepID=UPI00342CD89D